ncbi:DHA2 family efflux MFS transporter permease subunit [Paenibacillus thermotolerans]|uniref:DHA2 family efflux MFS transporter permease subunit n=1 Tax=Paenibacillus thermotolerans TaxID=3027807 RepID=UPI0023680AEA|nr:MULTISPECIES: DHA2 family efflux MFS transporter permease subunit [unclassified Paenibacillus]
MNHATATPERPPYGIIAILMIGAFIAFLNNTLLNIALPSIMKDLDVNASTVQWLTTGFMLVNGIMIPTTAFLIQKYSVRRLFLTAMTLFTIGTIIAGVAHVFSLLLVARMIQASGSAIAMPLLMNVMLVSFPVHKRGAAMGVFGLILMFAPAIGPTLSGWIIEHYDWRMLFHFVTPIAAVILVVSFFLLRDKKEKVDIRLDFLSLLQSSAGFGGLLYGFSSAGNNGWGSPLVYASIGIGVIALVSFIWRQLQQQNPLLNFGVFQFPMFALSSSITMIVNMALFSGMLLLPIYVQTLRGISPMDAGLMLLPGAILNAFMSPVNGKLFDKYGGRVLAVIGLTIMTVTTYLFSRLTLSTGYTHLLILNAVRMFGMSMVMMPVSTNGLNQLPARLYPHGTAMNNTLNQVSAAIGTALLITVMSTRAETHGAEIAEDAMRNGVQITKEQLEMEAMLGGINDAFFVAAILAAISLVLAFFIKRSSPAKEKLTAV